MNSKLPIILVVIGIVLVGGSLFFFLKPSTNTSPTNNSPANPSTGPSLPPDQVVVSIPTTPNPAGSLSNQGFTKIEIDAPIKLNNSATIKILGAQFRPASDVNTIQTVEGESQRSIITPGYQGIIIYYQLINTASSNQATVSFNYDAINNPLMYISDNKANKINKRNSILDASLLAFYDIPANTDETSGFTFEIPKQYTDYNALSVVINYPGFTPPKSYVQLAPAPPERVQPTQY